MLHSLPRLDNSDYAVGWITALPHEKAAAKAMLDQVHAPPRHKNANDHNNYTLGAINGPNGEHNVVIASLPSGRYGTITAATVAGQMLSSFPSIKFGLMVGIGGGIPNDEHDIRLGDVVVSQPTGTFGGVRQYDCGKATAHGFEECGVLNCPPDVLLNAMGELQSNHEMMGGTSIPDILESMYEAYPAMADSRKGPAYIHQGTDNDRLFSADYMHAIGKKNCSECDSTNEIQRPQRLDRDPCIHYGTIASGNKVIKDARVRDLLSNNCLCFEMEAAGLMNQFPCLVIRGICDYCDTHKNDRWQKYAAATAAAYAKELLQVTDASDIQNTPEARGIVMDNLLEIKSIIKDFTQDKKRKDLFTWLSPLRPSARHSENQRKRVEGTGTWILEDPRFLDWLADRPGSQALCCYGNPGAGKTIISSVVLDRIRELVVSPGSPIGLAFLYGDYRDQKNQTTENVLGAIVKQLLTLLPDIPQSLLELHEEKSQQEVPLDLPNAEGFLDVACEQFSRVYICIDALDELIDQRALLSSLHGRPSSIQVFVTGRPHVERILQRYFKSRQDISIEAHEDDIRRYIDHEIGGPNDTEPDAMDEKLKLDIQKRVLASAKGVFLLPVLQVHAVLQATTIRRREEALKTLSSNLGDAFAGTMARIEQQPNAYSEQAKRIIAWVCLAERSLSVDELLCSLAIEDGDENFNPRGIPLRGTLLNCCHGLAVIDQETCTVRLVHYSLEEFLSQQEQLFGLTKTQWHSRIARTCLTFLNFPTGAVEEGHMDATLLLYASTKWGHHLRWSEHLPDAPLLLAKDYLNAAPTIKSASLRLLYKEMYRDFVESPQDEALPVHIAAFFGIYQVMIWLSFTTVGLDVKDIVGRTPLSWAAGGGYQMVVRLLIQKGAVINSRDIYNSTPLLLSLQHKKEAVAMLLLREGATVDLNDNYDSTPLSLAAMNGYETVAGLIIERGAPVDPIDGMGRTPLAWAAVNGHDTVAKVLADKGAALNGKERYGRTPLILAASRGHKAVARLLLDKGAAVDSVERKYGRTALLWATVEGYEEIVKLLLERGATVDFQDAGFGWSPLSWAAVNGFETIVRQLVEKGATVDLAEGSGYGRTPLFLALEARNETIVKILISHSSAVDLKGNPGRAPILWDAEKGLDALMDLLGFVTDYRGHRSKRIPKSKDAVNLYFD
ncbi:hypothetical protein BBP40_010457 [Aspergillus hancockii]|nr:hypothetical protein BBP40_010457 [Aspergillus hancockii]